MASYDDTDIRVDKEYLKYRQYYFGVPPSLNPEGSQELRDFKLPGGEKVKEIGFEGEVDSNRYEIQGRYRTGAHSVIYRALDKNTGKVVGIKKHQHYISEADTPEEIRTAEARFGKEAQVLSRLNHPGIMKAYGYYFKDEDGISTPHLIMELIQEDSLEEKLRVNGGFNEQESKYLIMSVGTILDHMHNVNGRPIIYRDLKPDNIKVMSKDSNWPHKLVDFSESRIGKVESAAGSVMGTIGYNAPETYGGGMVDRSTDFYSLMRIAAHMLIGDNRKFMNTWFGSSTLRGMKEAGDLNISEDFLKAIEKGTESSQEKRYQGIIEVANDLGYKINQPPRTREELEAILGYRSLPVKIEAAKEEAKPVSKEVQKNNTVNVPAKIEIKIVEGRDIYLHDEGKPYLIGLEKDNIYETLKDIRTRGVFGTGIFESTHKGVLAYLELAETNGHLPKGVASGEKTLEGLVREKKPYEHNFLEADSGPHAGLHTNKEAFDAAKQQHKQRREQMCKLLGVDDTKNRMKSSIIGDFVGGAAGIGFAIEVGNSPYSLLSILGPIFGTAVGILYGRYSTKRKLLKRARELDGWVREARVSQGLEKKVENIKLSGEEISKIDDYINGKYNDRESMVTALSLITTGLGVFGAPFFDNPYALAVSAVAILAARGSAIMRKTGLLKKYFTSRALKKKRIAAGLSAAPEMKIYSVVHLKRETVAEYLELHYFIKKFGLKQNFWDSRKYKGKDIQLESFIDFADDPFKKGDPSGGI